ncbi:hypothetical protein A3E96_02640 [Candidatus Uhrbacteria bacterium RIFCSPHIGHO2_12_FULL_46_13]|uniref:Uncharacterized protein n=1 Tax=Candidatus Uhrbacteria bacterium RIFCSPLOWO2_01_FULL_47_25 TaxID=1802402 RepID=A0A1F7UXQ8_9BACT|nr:MAG: hypothetical protein A2752_03130 [Candidatus Uhrbacteria bacterium RIFCSPHIGHO2_01_FULL_46_23]OGL70549.1 MAG: hypothetical protein A3D60_03700 [Candidatus Uhrbacteria bacterium RIFCSPHIGHO2_02_FULL_47_29]OGL75805.1 MAG: hypothetical protein A3E96_02640 [Candidatus Uhrbacteria bacterium RIFCSPHIGHO2_12_FULL_46_13]OGL83082.1 MAG: hypothetical protein A2936_05205 [Candidatus Uhrbacteria bacterium RIFCSPLOWO2_01_FULL_47_25]OGL84171.1 MAG: hypothetical protein A3I37_03315 [Candidatus Uhrbact
MNKQFIKRLVATGSAVALLAPLAVLAQVDYGTTLGEQFGLGTGTDVKGAIINIIKFLLTFLGLIAVIIVLYGGFQWMTAAGNEEKITSARSTLTAGLIGLVIILAAYAITSFIIQTVVSEVTN